MALIAIIAASCGSSADTVAEVGSETLSQSDLEVMTSQGTDNDPGTVDKATAAQAITQWIRTELWIAELSRRDFPLTDEHIDAARAEIDEAAAADPTVPDLDTRVGAIVIRAQALGYLVADYLGEVEGVVPDLPRQLCSSHILLMTEDDAIAVVERLDAGEDFAALAIELSTGPSGPSGGDLGCVDPAGFIAEFVAGAEAVDAPGISEPVESQFGWHVINVHSFESADVELGPAYNQAVFAAAGDLLAEIQAVAMAADVSVGSQFGGWDAESFLVDPNAG